MVPVQKNFFDKKKYKALDFKHCLEQQNWQKMYVQNSLDSMLQVFAKNFSKALSENALLYKCLIQNDKKLTLTYKWLTRKSGQLMFDRDMSLDDKDNEYFFDLRSRFSFSTDNHFNRFCRNLFEAAENDRKNWMLINEVRNSEKKTQNLLLEKCIW